MTSNNIESQQRRQSDKEKRWPKWLRSKFLVRGLLRLGPLIYSLIRFIYRIWNNEDW